MTRSSAFVAYDLVCIHKSFIIPNTLQKLNFLQHIHIESRQCVAVVARTLCDAAMGKVLCNSQHISLPPVCVEFQRTKKENFARRSPESFPFFRCAAVAADLRLCVRACTVDYAFTGLREKFFLSPTFQ